jgi:hypothetical protein
MIMIFFDGIFKVPGSGPQINFFIVGVKGRQAKDTNIFKELSPV